MRHNSQAEWLQRRREDRAFYHEERALFRELMEEERLILARSREHRKEADKAFFWAGAIMIAVMVMVEVFL